MSTYAYGPSAPVPSRRSGMRTAGRWMFFIGLILSLVTVAATIWGGVQVFRAATAMESSTIPVEGATTVPMAERSMRLIVSSGTDDPSCTVTAPDGSSVPTTPDQAMRDFAADQQYRVVGTITATSAGDYTVECSAPAEITGALPASAVIGATAVALGLLALIPLGILTLVGLILWLVGRSRDRKAALAPGVSWGYGGQPGPPPYGAQSGQPQYGAPSGARQYGDQHQQQQGYGDQHQQPGYGGGGQDPAPGSEPGSYDDPSSAPSPQDQPLNPYDRPQDRPDDPPR